MAPNDLRGQRLRRLNPFAFPSETDFLFALLMFLIISVCLANFFILFLTTPTTFQRTYFATIEDCLRRFPISVEPEPAPASDLDGLMDQITRGAAHLAPTTACYQPIVNQLIARIFAATAAVLIGAGLIFQFAPRWTIRRHQLSPLTAEDVPEVIGYLDGLCAEMQLRRQPSFRWNPLNATRSAFAFGNLSRQYVAMNMGLVSQYFSDRAAFRAVLLHELAHIRNADLVKTQFATALWYAFLALAALPGLFFSLFIDASGDGFGPLAWGRLWQVALLTGLVYFVRNGILRAREYYADVRASTYLAGPDALEQILASDPGPERSGPRRWFATHPPNGKRVDVLNDTRPLFVATFEVAAITGVVMGIIFATNELWASSLGNRYFSQNAGLALLLAILLTGTIGLSVWRGTTAGLLGSAVRQNPGRLALGVGIGLFFGAQVIDLAGTLDFLDVADRASIIGLQISIVAAATFGAGITYAIGLWAIACATAWSEYAAGRRSPRIVYAGWFLVAAGITAILIYPLTIAFWMSQYSSQIGVELVVLGGLFFISAIPSYLVGSTWGAILFLGIWALPLAAWLYRRQFRPVGEASWGYLEPDAGHGRAGNTPLGGNEPGRLIFSMGVAARSALVLGAVSLSLVTLKWVVRFGQGVEPGPGAAYDDLFGEATLASLILLPIILVVWVVARARQFRVSHALFAVFLLGVFVSIANNMINGFIETGRLFANPQYYWQDMKLVWGVGLLGSLPVAVALWLMPGARRPRPD